MNGDTVYDATLEYGVGYLHARDDLRDDRVVVIQSHVVYQVYKDLSVSGITATRGYPNRSAQVGTSCQLVTGIGSVSGVFVGARATALNDEVGCHTMKGETVEVPRAG